MALETKGGRIMRPRIMVGVWSNCNLGAGSTETRKKYKREQVKADNLKSCTE